MQLLITNDMWHLFDIVLCCYFVWHILFLFFFWDLELRLNQLGSLKAKEENETEYIVQGIYFISYCHQFLVVSFKIFNNLNLYQL